MAPSANLSVPSNWIDELARNNFLFRGLDVAELADCLLVDAFSFEKLYSSRPIYTAFQPDESLQHLYGVLSGGPVVVRSTPLDRIISLTYPGSCFGMQSLLFDCGRVVRAFPSL
ncbi:MAG: Crp/Fnr family transcriptional regulator, partial [Leptolyngbya sp. SIO4C1]|nr:Crp/Fnr family transcriptional regulator [Leptolyngbya sp. SIO4C1]